METREIRILTRKNCIFLSNVCFFHDLSLSIPFYFFTFENQTGSASIQDPFHDISCIIKKGRWISNVLMVENTGLEPVISWLPVKRAPSCANSPYVIFRYEKYFTMPRGRSQSKFIFFPAQGNVYPHSPQESGRWNFKFFGVRYTMP